jgi:L-fucose isomerase-like protein
MEENIQHLIQQKATFGMINGIQIQAIDMVEISKETEENIQSHLNSNLMTAISKARKEKENQTAIVANGLVAAAGRTILATGEREVIQGLEVTGQVLIWILLKVMKMISGMTWMISVVLAVNSDVVVSELVEGENQWE